MKNLLRRIQSDLRVIDPGSFTEPSSPVAPGETVVGKMTVFQRRLFTYITRTAQRGKKLQADAKDLCLTGRHEEEGRLRRSLHFLEKRLELLRGIFFADIADQFGLVDKPTVGVRAGYKVVWHEHVLEEPLMAELLMCLMEGVRSPGF